MKTLIYQESGIYVYSDGESLFVRFDVGNLAGQIAEIPISLTQYEEIKKGPLDARKLIKSLPVSKDYLI